LTVQTLLGFPAHIADTMPIHAHPQALDMSYTSTCKRLKLQLPYWHAAHADPTWWPRFGNW